MDDFQRSGRDFRGQVLLDIAVGHCFWRALLLYVECVMRVEIQRPQFELRTEILNAAALFSQSCVSNQG